MLGLARCVATLGLALTVAVGCLDVRGGDDTTSGSCSADDAKRILHEHMLDYYLWWDEMPAVSRHDYADPQALLIALRVNPPDRWSYVVPQAVDEAYYAGDGYVGIGIVTTTDAAGALRVTVVYGGSPAQAAGLGRGDTLLAIGGQSVEAIDAAGTWDSAWGAREVGTEVTLHLRSVGGVERSVTLVKDVVVPPSVSLTTVIVRGALRVGYLVLDRFIAPTSAELEQAFAQLQADDVDELVVDLRYNGGGYVSVARYLAELIGGERTATHVLAREIFNSKHTAFDGDTIMGTVASALGVARVVFVTTEGTASASELVINGLRPFLDVVDIGTPTHGKPVGMVPVTFCDLTLAPVTFELVNADGEGGYYDGIAPTCAAPDDLEHGLGDENEASLAQALYYLEHGTCAPAAPGVVRPGPRVRAPPRADAFAATVGAL